VAGRRSRHPVKHAASRPPEMALVLHARNDHAPNEPIFGQALVGAESGRRRGRRGDGVAGVNRLFAGEESS
jgi:hypothetical protein